MFICLCCIPGLKRADLLLNNLMISYTLYFNNLLFYIEDHSAAVFIRSVGGSKLRDGGVNYFSDVQEGGMVHVRTMLDKGKEGEDIGVILMDVIHV